MIKETNAPEETSPLENAWGTGKAGRSDLSERRYWRRENSFTKGFAEGLGITEPVNSPTFTIVQQYDSGRMPLYHFDIITGSVISARWMK